MKRLLALIVAVAAAVALAGVYLPSDAATVNSATVSGQSLDADLSAVGHSSDYSCFYAEERSLAGEKATPVYGAGSTSATSGSYGTTFTDDWLDSMVTDQVVAELVARDGLTVTPADVAIGRSVLSRRITGVLEQYAEETDAQAAGCGGTGGAVLESLPGWFVTQQVTAEANQAVLDAHVAGTGLGTAALDSYYAAHGANFDRYCVSVIIVKTQAAADSAQAAIAGGTSFAQEASAVSITGGSAADGGQGGCGLIEGTFLASELDKAPLDAVTAPFSAEGVYWLAMVTTRTAEPLSAVRTAVVTTILQSGQTGADAQLKAAIRAADLTIDPRYGEPATSKVALIDPPSVPPASALVSPDANVPSVAPAGS